MQGGEHPEELATKDCCPGKSSSPNHADCKLDLFFLFFLGGGEGGGGGVAEFLLVPVGMINQIRFPKGAFVSKS